MALKRFGPRARVAAFIDAELWPLLTEMAIARQKSIATLAGHWIEERLRRELALPTPKATVDLNP